MLSVFEGELVVSIRECSNNQVQGEEGMNISNVSIDPAMLMRC